MPLGSESALGLAGPNGTPDIAELPAPAEPAGGVNCANALFGAIRANAVQRTSAGLRNIEVSPESTSCNGHVVRAFPRLQIVCFQVIGFPAIRLATE
jgi:hypothetical protein